MKKPTPFKDVIDNKHPFTTEMIEYISSKITDDLLDIFAPEKFGELMKKLNSYPEYKKGTLSEPEELMRFYCEYIFEDSFPKKRYRWLRGIGGRSLELDGNSERLKIAFECDGPVSGDTNKVNEYKRLAADERQKGKNIDVLTYSEFLEFLNLKDSYINRRHLDRFSAFNKLVIKSINEDPDLSDAYNRLYNLYGFYHPKLLNLPYGQNEYVEYIR